MALVTGGSRGIGRAAALCLAEAGLRVAVHCTAAQGRGESLLAGLANGGHRVFEADFLDAASPWHLWDAVTRAFGRVDVLVNNAGIYEKLTPVEAGFGEWQENWNRTIATNLTAPAHLAFLAAQAMARHGGGRIVNVSSRGAFRGEATAPPYGAAKAGLNALGQSLAKAFAGHGVYVFAVAPGWVDTDMAAPHITGERRGSILEDIPLGRVATVEEIARIVAWLGTAAPASMTGSIIDANGASYLRM